MQILERSIAIVILATAVACSSGVHKNKAASEPGRWPVYPQQTHISYSAAESAAIHDSINNSRWDIGGSLSKYSFRYMSEFFPVAVINKPPDPYRFSNKKIKSIENITVKTKEGSRKIDDYLTSLHISAFIVVHKGNIAYERYFSMHPQDRHTLQSVTKVLTSTLIASLVNDHAVNIDNPIENYIPELASSDWKGIPVKDILNMRSGMDIRSIDFSTGPFTNPLHKNYQLESALGILPAAQNTPASVYKFLAELKRDTVNGLDAAYSNIDSFVLGWLAEKVTGRKYADLLSERVWQPMGAASNAYVCLSGNGIPWPHGGISATLRDLARFGMLYTRSDIEQRKEKIISLSQLKDIFDAAPARRPGPPFSWAYQWDLAGDGILMKSGFGGQGIYIVPEKDIVIAYYNYVDKDWGMNLVTEALIQEIFSLLSGGTTK